MRNGLSAIFGSTVRIGLSKTGIALLRTRGGWSTEATILADQPLTVSAAMEPERLALQCATILADSQCAGLPLTIILCEEWVRLFMVTPPQNTGKFQDIQAAAAMRFQALYGESINDWHLDADWNACEPFFACALPRKLLGTLQQAAQESKTHLLSVVPQFVVVWNKWYRKLNADAWFGVAQENVLTLGAIEQGPQQHLRAIYTTSIPLNGQDPRWIQDQVSRTALRLNLPAPSQLQLYGNLPSNWIKGNSRPNNTLAISNAIKTSKSIDNSAPNHPYLSAAVLLARSGMDA